MRGKLDSVCVCVCGTVPVFPLVMTRCGGTTLLTSCLFWTGVIDFSVVVPNVQYADSEPLPLFPENRFGRNKGASVRACATCLYQTQFRVG